MLSSPSGLAEQFDVDQGTPETLINASVQDVILRSNIFIIEDLTRDLSSLD